MSQKIQGNNRSILSQHTEGGGGAQRRRGRRQCNYERSTVRKRRHRKRKKALEDQKKWKWNRVSVDLHTVSVKLGSELKLIPIGTKIRTRTTFNP